MRYVTTHGALAADTHAQRPASVSLRTAMLEGLAPDGGLYVPESIEPWRDAEIAYRNALAIQPEDIETKQALDDATDRVVK